MEWKKMGEEEVGRREDETLEMLHALVAELGVVELEKELTQFEAQERAAVEQDERGRKIPAMEEKKSRPNCIRMSRWRSGD